MKPGRAMLGLVAGLWLTTSADEVAKLEVPVVAAKVQPAIMQLMITDRTGKELASGNGFCVAAGGKLVTSLRLIEKARSVIAVTDHKEQVGVVGILAMDAKNDLALLKLAVTNQTFLPLAEPGRALPGLHVAVVSSPWVVLRPPAEGRVFAVRELFADLRRIQIKAAIDPGAGGSPVVDAEGAVIGMIRALVRDPRLYNLTVPADAIAKLLANAGSQALPFLPLHTSGDMADDELFRTEEWNRAVAALELEDWEELLQAGDALVRRFPAYAEAQACVGTASVELKLYDRATAAYRRVVQLEPDNRIAWINLGNNFSVQGKDDDAVAVYRQIVIRWPHFMVAWTKLGATYCRQGKYGDAIAMWRQAVGIVTDDPSAWANLGVSYEGQGKLDDAVTAYRRAVKLEPDYPFVWVRLGVIEGQLGRNDDARAAHRRALELKPDFPMVWLSLNIDLIFRTNTSATVESGPAR